MIWNNGRQFQKRECNVATLHLHVHVGVAMFQTFFEICNSASLLNVQIPIWISVLKKDVKSGL